MKISIFVFSLILLLFSCNKVSNANYSNNERIEELMKKHGILNEEYDLVVPEEQEIPEEEWVKFENQIIAYKKGINLNRQRSLYQSQAQPFIDNIIHAKYDSSLDRKAGLAIARSLIDYKFGKSVKTILDTVKDNPEYFPNELISKLEEGISTGKIRDINLTQEEIEFINAFYKKQD